MADLLPAARNFILAQNRMPAALSSPVLIKIPNRRIQRVILELHRELLFSHAWGK
jgi:hypothetical protein